MNQVTQTSEGFVYNDTCFTWCPRTRSFVTEVSEFKYQMPGRQFGIRSSKTGKVAYFKYERKIYNGEGEDTELAGWQFGYHGNESTLMDLRVIFFND